MNNILESFKKYSESAFKNIGYRMNARFIVAKRSYFLEKNGMDFRLLTLKQINDLSRCAIRLSKGGISYNDTIDNIKRYYNILNGCSKSNLTIIRK